MRVVFIKILLASLLANDIEADSFIFNTLNNHGSVGLINTPTARIYNESSFGITFYNGNPDQKITMTSSPYDWLEASFFIAILAISLTADLNLILYAIKTTKIKDLILKLN